MERPKDTPEAKADRFGAAVKKRFLWAALLVVTVTAAFFALFPGTTNASTAAKPAGPTRSGRAA